MRYTIHIQREDIVPKHDKPVQVAQVADQALLDAVLESLLVHFRKGKIIIEIDLGEEKVVKTMKLHRDKIREV